MNRHIKSNILVICIMLMLGLLSLNSSTYLEKRFLGILISITELMIVLFLAHKQNMSLREMGLVKPKKPVAWAIGILISLTPIFLMLVLNGGKISSMFPEKMSLLICILQTLYYFIIVAPVEEIIFRGFILENFNKSYSQNISIILTSFLFSIIHIYSGNIINIVMAFIISMLYCKVKLTRNNHSLYPCMVGHAINDSLNQWIPYFLL